MSCQRNDGNSEHLTLHWLCCINHADAFSTLAENCTCEILKELETLWLTSGHSAFWVTVHRVSRGEMIHDIPTVFSSCQQRSRVAHLEKAAAASLYEHSASNITCLLKLQKSLRHVTSFAKNLWKYFALLSVSTFTFRGQLVINTLCMKYSENKYSFLEWVH